MATPEGRIKARLKRRLKEEFDAMIYMFWPVQMGLGATTLDCLIGYRGWFFAIETKAPGKKMTPRQEQCRDAMKKAGIIVFTVDSNESIERVIDTFKRVSKYAH